MNQERRPPRNNSKLLIEEPPLVVLPSLARAIGIAPAIALQQLHYWVRQSPHWYDGRQWVYNTHDQWYEQLPFGSVHTVRRVFEKLEDLGLVLSGNYNKSGTDRTKWYTIDYEAVDALLDQPINSPPSGKSAEPSSENARPSVQFGHIEGQGLKKGGAEPVAIVDKKRRDLPKMGAPSVQNGRMQAPNLDNSTITENTSEITQERNLETASLIGAREDDAPPRYSPYIAGVVQDHLRELGDSANIASQVNRALNLWIRAGCSEESFVQACHRTREKTRRHQTHILNRGAWYFTALEQEVCPPTAPVGEVEIA